jgi:hypothetical protein
MIPEKLLLSRIYLINNLYLYPCKSNPEAGWCWNFDPIKGSTVVAKFRGVREWKELRSSTGVVDTYNFLILDLNKTLDPDIYFGGYIVSVERDDLHYHVDYDPVFENSWLQDNKGLKSFDELC